MRRRPFSVRVCALALMAGTLAACSLPGCRHPGDRGGWEDGRSEVTPANRDLARGALSAVEIHGQSLATVRDTVESVFTEAGFQVQNRKPDQITFERKASRGQVAAYGNWQGMEVRIRLRVDFLEQTSARVLAVCRSHVVREAGTMAEDEQPLGRARVRQYEPLLREVATRLN